MFRTDLARELLHHALVREDVLEPETHLAVNAHFSLADAQMPVFAPKQRRVTAPPRLLFSRATRRALEDVEYL